MLRFVLSAFALVVLSCLPALAGKADVWSVELEETAPGVYTVTAEVEHADDGWDHYADAWDVLTPDGKVIATRELAHPHMNEQPFIRSLSGVEIPADVVEITVRARDLVHGFGGREVTVKVPRSALSRSSPDNQSP